jgi:hypothetical protein
LSLLRDGLAAPEEEEMKQYLPPMKAYILD